MKFRKTASAIIISILLIAISVSIVMVSKVYEKGTNRIIEEIENILSPGKLGLDISVASIDSTLIKSVTAKGITLKANGTELAYINTVRIGASVVDVIRLALSSAKSQIGVSVQGVKLNINQNSIDALTYILSQNSTKEANEAKAISLPELNLFVRDVEFDVSYAGFESDIKGVNLDAYFDNNLEFKQADINIPEILALMSYLSGSELQLKDIRLSLDSELSISGSIADAIWDKGAKSAEISAIAKLDSKSLYSAFYFGNIDFSGAELGLALEADLMQSMANLTYNFETGEIDLALVSAEVDADSSLGKFVSEGFELSASLESLKNLAFKLKANSLSSTISDFDFSLEDIEADIGLNIDSLSSIGQVIFNKANVKGLDRFYCPKVGLSSAILDYSYSKSGLGLRLQSFINGKSSIEELGNFSATIDASIQANDFSSIPVFSVKAQDLEIQALPYKAELNLSFDGKGNISAFINDNKDFSATINYQRNHNMADLRLNLFEFRPFDYSLLYKKYLGNQNYIGQNTELEGSIMTSVSLASDILNFADISSSFDVIEEGRVSINTAIRNIKLGKSSFSTAFAFESVINEFSADISSLAITAGGLRLSYGGTFDMKGLYPVGKLILQNASDGKKLASAEFTHVEGKDSYDIVFASPLVDADLTCALDILDLNHISADTVLKAGFLEKDLGISVLLQLRPFNLSLDSDQIKANAYFDDSKVMLDGQVNKLSVIAKDNLAIKIDSALNGFYDLENGKYNAALSGLFVKISDTLSTGFDFEVSNEKVILKDLYLGLNKEDFNFDGKVDIDFGDIKELLAGDTQNLKGTIALISKGVEIKGSIIDQQYYLNVDFSELGNKKTSAKLSLLGTVSNGFYLQSKADWGSLGSGYVLNAQLKNGILSLYDTSAMVGTLKLSNFNLNLDFKKMLLSGGFDFKNEYPFYDETTKIQSGSIVLGARFQALASNIFQIIAGLDYNLDFVLGIKNVKLADGYNIADTNVDVSFRKDKITVAGNSINGFFDLKTREIDLVVSRKLLFGFSLHGYVEKNLDLYVSELYFPLPVLNQFLNTPIFSIQEGIIEGDVLIRGPISEPTFYGMAYCQSFALDLLYLPEQTVNIKNCAFVFLDHSMYMTKTPFSCYSDLDGRYAYGDVTVEMIMRGLGVHTFDVKTYVYKDSPIDLWFPSKLGATDIELRGDVTGLIDFKFDEGRAVLETDIVASKAMVDFKLDNPPIWWRKNESNGSIDMNVTMTTGTNVEFFYPDKDNAFMNFTLAEGKRFNLKLSDGVFSTDGGVALKSGQIYYFHNDFIVSEGKLNMTQKKFNPNTSLPFVLDLTATLIDYDANGNKVEINLILQNATLDNISPRFTSTPTMSQTEILEMLGQTIFDMSKADTKMSVSSLASIAATASSALTRVGVFEADDSYSLAGTIRKAIGLDVFSARSNILANIIVNALPGQITSSEEVSVLARYLDGTSIYAGKHLGDNLFFRITFMLKADNSNSRSDKVGRFMAKDLLLDTEISIDFDNPMGTFNIFTKPKELSVFDVLDTIGFSVTKQIQF